VVIRFSLRKNKFCVWFDCLQGDYDRQEVVLVICRKVTSVSHPLSIRSESSVVASRVTFNSLKVAVSLLNQGPVNTIKDVHSPRASVPRKLCDSFASRSPRSRFHVIWKKGSI
jgi:hypothetical protein